MTVDQHYFRSLVHAGSSRVFNCNETAQKLIDEGDAAPFLFRTPGLNFSVIFKEVMLEPDLRRGRRSMVGTRLFFPSDTHFIYEGERSIYLHDPQLLPQLRKVLGSEAGADEAALEHDLGTLAVLDRLPSFDAFLTRDALESAGVTPNPRYFPVPSGEQQGLREFIRRKFDPLVRRALDGAPISAAKSMALVNKIWEANDAEGLAPLTEALRFPPDDALAIFSAWKSINVYGFRYVQGKPPRETFALWLRDQAKEKEFSRSGTAGYIEFLRRDTVTRLRHHWRIVEEITREHDRLYGELLRSAEAVPPFITFLQHGRQLSCRMGLSLSKIDHAIGAWKMAMDAYPLGVMPPTDLRILLPLLSEILVIDEVGHANGALRERAIA